MSGRRGIENGSQEMRRLLNFTGGTSPVQAHISVVSMAAVGGKFFAVVGVGSTKEELN